MSSKLECMYKKYKSDESKKIVSGGSIEEMKSGVEKWLKVNGSDGDVCRIYYVGEYRSIYWYIVKLEGKIVSVRYGSKEWKSVKGVFEKMGLLGKSEREYSEMVWSV